jgi:hypothetical protein
MRIEKLGDACCSGCEAQSREISSSTIEHGAGLANGSGQVVPSRLRRIAKSVS